MVLQFQPPPDWLIQGYLDRQNQNPVVDAINGVNEVMGTYAKQKALQQQQALAQQQRDIEMAKGLSAGGQDFTTALATIQAQRQAPTSPTAQGPSLIDRAKAFFGAAPVGKSPTTDMGVPGNIPPAPSTGTVSGMMPAMPAQVAPSPMTTNPTTDPLVQEYMQDPVAFKRQHGEQGIAKLKTQLEIDKGIQDKTKGPLKTMTKEQALAQGTFDPTKELMVEPPNRLDIGTKEDQFYQKEWDKIVKETNPLTASSRSTLGMASKANFQADRALTTLSKPVVTNQEAGNVMADIAAIYQTGSPTQFGMSHQEYLTLYGKVKGALQALTGNPQDALPNAIKQRLVGVLTDMKGTNNQILKQQLDLTERSKRKIIHHGFDQDWKDLRASLESPGIESTISGGGNVGAAYSDPAKEARYQAWKAAQGKP